MVVTFSLKELSERSQLIRCAVFIFLSYAACYLSLTLYQEANLNKINWMMMLYFGINFILLMFTYVLVYMLEKTFGYVSSITLVELSNINNPILKKLSETCPGTFQHSLQVSILASEAAAKIGANAQLVRTGALYHDIGKMSNPVFFTENQSSVNPHNQLSFDKRADHHQPRHRGREDRREGPVTQGGYQLHPYAPRTWQGEVFLQLFQEPIPGQTD